MATTRIAGKAVIIENDRLLVTCNEDRDGRFYLLPGGGQEFGESLAETVQRECYEEIGCDVIVGDIVFVRDYIGDRHEENLEAFTNDRNVVHQVEVMFRCTLAPGEIPNNGPGADSWQTGVEWMPLDTLADQRFYPHAMCSWLLNGHKDECPIYLGATN